MHGSSKNTGTQDKKGRTIFKGSKGGFFVRVGGPDGNKNYRKSPGKIPTFSSLKKALGL
jgi:hypothetical protein